MCMIFCWNFWKNIRLSIYFRWFDVKSTDLRLMKDIKRINGFIKIHCAYCNKREWFIVKNARISAEIIIFFSFLLTKHWKSAIMNTVLNNLWSIVIKSVFLYRWLQAIINTRFVVSFLLFYTYLFSNFICNTPDTCRGIFLKYII